MSTVDDRVGRIQAEWRDARPDVDVSPQGIIGRLHRLADALTAELTAVYAEHGLSEGEFDVLATLRRAGPPFERAPGELAEHTMVTTGAMTKRLDRLVAAGLVTRRLAGGDGRRRVVALTTEGLERIDAAFTDHMINERRLVDELPAADRAALERILTSWLSHHDAAGPA
ncbi:MarR family winged helix-turn-helix transcriptional regulator [Herbiconiux solani]|uniref:MarR family winged helix-turn-helix transcriptional regulator n=1 Tax=Herbiconiux solani TaxID=661329 RepID=UPI0008240A99|nr:MarR family transcriptional regulator [Herbiconiux solani]